MEHFSSRNLLSLAGVALLTGIGLILPGTRSVAQFAYCVPTTSTTCGTGDYIQSFSTTGGSTNITNNNSGCNGAANNYMYYSTQSVTTTAGSTFNFSITNAPAAPQFYGIWVDWNSDWDFADPGEQVYTSTGTIAPSATTTGSISIPLTTTSGTRRMRVRSQGITSTVTPCAFSFYGEIEDYNVVVQSSTPCNGMPNAGNIMASSPNACASSLVTLLLTSYTTAPNITIQWQSSPNGTTYTNISGATNPAYVFSQTTSTYYRAVVTCSGTTFSANTQPVYIMMSPSCQDSVWPGDANYDQVANTSDFFAIAVNWGLSGSTRTSANNTWTPQFSMNWVQTFSSGINKKNIDCNGDGVIGWGDTVAVSQNFGLTHPKGNDAENPVGKTAGLPDLFVDLSGLALTPGTTVTAPIRFGSTGSPVTRIYGVAATVQMGGTATVGTPAVTLNPSWMGTPLQTVRFARATSGNTADWVVVRNTRTDTNGYGTLGSVTFSIPANASGKLKVMLQNVTVIDSTGSALSAYNVLADSANIQATGVSQISGAFTVAKLVPNPSAAPILELATRNAGAAEIQLVDAMGRQVSNMHIQLHAGFQQIPLQMPSLPAGVYGVQIRMSDGSAAQTLRWIKP